MGHVERKMGHVGEALAVVFWGVNVKNCVQCRHRGKVYTFVTLYTSTSGRPFPFRKESKLCVDCRYKM